MPPGILRLRTACCTLVIPVRLAICLPLLICTLDAYSPHAAPFPQATLPPLIVNITRPDATGSNTLEDAHSAHAYEYISLPPLGPNGARSPPLGRALALSFVIAAAVLSVLSMIALWWPGDPPGDEDDATIKRGSFIAVEVLGWFLVAVMYCGAFHRVHCLLCDRGVPRGSGKEVLLVGKDGGTLEKN
ncbi:hypothetical protein F5148DRAFT_1182447 [Russula earlei]|uniref:Uncharacterized protein n=1 Tax=Russula earlei TaxID=71964 RepID=A0ACC0UEU4_9AGAM|nr:hypothetical protein F5148DRAFT_1182447 [Russula earlei]